MRIGELAKATGVPVSTIRFYEKQGLLSRAARRYNGYREFSEAAAGQLRFIGACRKLGIPIAGLKDIIGSAERTNAGCGSIAALVDAQLEQVRARINELRRLERQLQDLHGRCGAGRTIGECGILQKLWLHEQPSAASVRGTTHV